MTATLAPPEPDTTLDYPHTLLIGDQSDADHTDDGDVPEAFYTTNAPGRTWPPLGRHLISSPVGLGRKVIYHHA